MKQRPRIYYTEADKALMWDRWQKGESLNSRTRLFDRHHSAIQGVLARTGFDPAIVPESEFSRIHGNDGRISVEAFEHGVSDHLAIIGAVVYD